MIGTTLLLAWHYTDRNLLMFAACMLAASDRPLQLHAWSLPGNPTKTTDLAESLDGLTSEISE